LGGLNLPLGGGLAPKPHLVLAPALLTGKLINLWADFHEISEQVEYGPIKEELRKILN